MERLSLIDEKKLMHSRVNIASGKTSDPCRAATSTTVIRCTLNRSEFCESNRRPVTNTCTTTTNARSSQRKYRSSRFEPPSPRPNRATASRRKFTAVGLTLLLACIVHQVGLGSCTGVNGSGGTTQSLAPMEATSFDVGTIFSSASPPQHLTPSFRSTAATTILESTLASANSTRRSRPCVTPNCTEIDECAAGPCQNGATCEDRVGSHHCICPDGYAGLNCSEDIDECLSSPCLNGGTCVDGVGTFVCECPPGFLGPNCSRDVNECISSPCLNGGECTDKVGGYECRCAHGWNGSRCEIDVDECLPLPCQNRGRCEDTIGDYNCNCLKPWGGKNCELNSEPCLHRPCQNNATCTNDQHHPGNFSCHCASGFAGDSCEQDLDECLSNPCSNGAHCIDRPGHFSCRCPPEYGGPTCAELYDDCTAHPCHNGGTCHTQLLHSNSTCACAAGFEGNRCETRVDGCLNVDCPSPRVCRETAASETVGHRCECPVGFEGVDCERNIDECVPGFCSNGGTCVDGVGNATCRCPSGFRGARCEQDTDECNPGANGTSPCLWGICKNNHGAYQCYCQPGYTGEFCHLEFDECLTLPCQHGGTCRDLVAKYKCLCPVGYSGKNCETDIDECESSPCQHGSTCVDRVGAFSCQCAPGFAGILCEQDIDECASTPCMHAGQCVDHVNGFTCNCSDTGFRGNLCQENIDECASNPCVNEAHCLDLVKDYSCQCHPGFEGKNCESDIAECQAAPCRHGGECLEKSNSTIYGLGDSLRPLGFPRGPYRHATAGGYICQCQRGFVGADCEINVDDCESAPCQHGGTCVDGVDAYTCECRSGFEGRHCESEIDECRRYRPCSSGSTCVNEFGDYSCSCVAGVGGKNCTVALIGCEQNDCMNGAECVPYLIGEDDHRRNCTCGHGFHGPICEHSTAMSFDGDTHYMIKVMGMASRPYTLSLRFRTTLPSGFLAMAYGLSHSFRLFLSDGVVHFKMPDTNMSTTLGERLNDGKWRTVRVAVTSAGVDLNLTSNDAGPLSISRQLLVGRNKRIVPHFSQTDVGGIEGWMRSSGMSRVPNYVGCMEDLDVSGSRVVPGMDPAQVGSPGISYPGSVIRGCARTEQCLPATCNGGGKCLDLWTNYTCQCLRPRYGLHCEHEYEAVTFGHENSSNSYAEILLSDDTRNRLRNNATVSLFLRTRQPDGLIFYLGNGNSLDGAGEEDTFLAAQLQGGVLRLSVKINGTPESLLDKSNRRLDDGYYHFVQVSLLNRTLSALLNGTTLINNMEVDAHRDRHLMATNLFLGGLGSPGHPASAAGPRSRRQFSQDPLVSDFATDDPPVELDLLPSPSLTPIVNPAIFFKGIMQDVRLNDLLVEVFPKKRETIPTAESLLKGNVTKVNILEGVQSDNSCHLSPCQNGSNCTITWNDYHCQCATGFRGKNCSDLEFCAFNDCPAFSECRSLSNGYECVANATFNGANSSASYTLTTDLTTIPLNHISMKFRSQHGGPVIHLSRGADFLEVALANSTALRLRWSAAAGDGSTSVLGTVGEESTTIPFLEHGQVATNQDEDDDEWHSLVVNIGQTVSLSLDDGFTLAGTADGVTLAATLTRMATTTNTADTPSHLKVTVGASGTEPGAEHYRGCLGEVRVGGILLPFFSRAQLLNDTSATYYEATSVAHLEVGECVLCYDAECQHGSVCLERRASRACNCSGGYEGNFCQTNIDECAGVTCDNGGTCADGIAAYTCQCVSGYDGIRCENEINECENEPCQNGGKCEDMLNAYNCNCTANYTGTNCEKEKAFDCSTHPCFSGATCINTILSGQETPGFQCICPVGRTGLVCDSEIDYCMSNTCASGSTCQNEPNLGRFRCMCVTGSEGRLCQDKTDFCKNQPCQHNGQCHSGEEAYTCSCPSSHTGHDCEEDVNECEVADPCENSALCVNLLGDYQCQCTNGSFVGKNCNITNPCFPDSCSHGVCYPSIDDNTGTATPLCNCTDPNFTGPTCDVKASADGLDAEMLGIVIGSVVAATILIVIGVLTVFLTMAKKKRATRGTYSPSRQEMFGSRVEMGNVMKPPPEERLI